MREFVGCVIIWSIARPVYDSGQSVVRVWPESDSTLSLARVYSEYDQSLAWLASFSSQEPGQPLS